MQFVQQNEATAAQRRIYFKARNEVNPWVGVTGLSFAAADIQVSKNGAAEGNSAGADTEIGGGDYFYEATLAEFDTLGMVSFRIAKAGVVVESERVQVVPWDPYALGLGGSFALTTAEHNNIADALLKRDWNAVTGEAARSCLNAFRFLRNKWTIIGSVLSVKEEDDATEAWNATLTVDATANPVTQSDPT